MSILASQNKQIQANHAIPEYPPAPAQSGEEWDRKADGLALAAAQAAISAGHKPVTPDVADGTVVTSFVNAIFQDEAPPKQIVIRRRDGKLGLYRFGQVACGIESTSTLDPDRLAMFTIDPADKPVNVIAERRAFEDRAGDRLGFDNRPARHDGGET